LKTTTKNYLTPNLINYMNELFKYPFLFIKLKKKKKNIFFTVSFIGFFSFGTIEDSRTGSLSLSLELSS
jgi:hypothetical protein